MWFSEEGSPAAPAERLLVRRSLGQDAEIKVRRSNAPAKIPLAKLAQVGGSRWTIEEDFQCAKGECGLDEYETRGWHGWRHHTALSMLALCFLAQQQERLGEKRTPDDGARSSSPAPALTRRSPLERTRNPRLVRQATNA